MNEETYRSILANATFGYAYYKTIFDGKGEPEDYEFLEVNVAFERFTGLKAADVIGKTVCEVIPGIKESSFDFTSHYDYVALNGGEKEFEQHFEPLNRWYKVQVLSTQKGYLTTIFTDITGILQDRLNQERENHREFEKFKQITTQISDIVWRTNLNFDTTYISPSIEKIMGFSVDEYLSISPEMRYSPQTLQKIQLLLDDELEKEKQQDIDKNRTIIIEVEHYKADKTIVPLELHVSFLRDETGTPVGLQGISRDITERKIFEVDIDHQNKFRKLLIEIASGFINTPLENVDISIQRALEELGRFVDADRSYTFYYDWEKDVCNNIHEWCADGISPEIDNLQNVPLSMMQDWVVAHKKGESMFISDLFLLPPGNVREILEPQGVKSLLAVPMNINGSCIGFVGFDSVRRHHIYSSADHQLLQVFAQVLANLRMRKLLEQNLIAAKEKAEESSRLKTAFINNISHEIRTPLNGILGFGGLMMDVAMPYDDKLQVYNLLQESTSRLIQTITDIMDISGLNTGTIVPKIADVHIANSINNQVEKNVSSCTKKKINLSAKIPDKYNDLILKTDEELFIKILAQLLSNAIKFTNEGEITIGFDADDKNLCFFVNDTGKGISADKLEIIFEPFVQEDVLNTRLYEGNGLGLPLAKGMVELLGGKIWVESEIGKGSTFFFEIPF
ncbi:MAG: ATP-binding protein [Bacteroidales bacterium]|nr:ATP-binding protein [Bacteroidales bacterium]